MNAVDDLKGHLTVLEVERECRRYAFRSPPDLTLSEWADEHRMLSPENSPEPGKWYTSRVPYLKEILDCCSDPEIERVVLMKSARIGATDGVIGNLVGYHIHLQPASIMVVQPIVDDAQGWSKEYLTPMLRDTPVLAGKVRESGRRESSNTILVKEFPGGRLVVVGSNAASGFRRRSIKVLLLDEVDGYALSARSAASKREGDPISLAIKRTQTFWDRFIFETSTPTLEGRSRIDQDYKLSDQRRYYVRCPFCDHEQTFKWRNFKWEDRDPETVHYICGKISKDGELEEGCGKAISEDHKTWMVQNGRWIAERPGRKIVGFHIWEAYSLLSSWVRMVEQWIEAQGDIELLQVFINTVLAETWSDNREEHDPQSLVARRENYRAEVPRGVAVLTAGVDVQGDRLEYSTWGFGRGEESWLIKHEVLWGDPGQTEVWEQLDLALWREWLHESGAKLRVRRAAIDSGGHFTDEVYRYCRARRKLGAYAIKGSSVAGAAAVGRPTKRHKPAIELFPLGTDALKDSIDSRLKVPVPGPRYMHFPWVDEEYFKQLTAEVKRYRYVNRRPVRRWEKRYERNEALDCAVYALAALIMLGPVRDQLGTIAEQIGKDVPRRPRRRVRSKGVR